LEQECEHFAEVLHDHIGTIFEREGLAVEARDLEEAHAVAHRATSFASVSQYKRKRVDGSVTRTSSRFEPAATKGMAMLTAGTATVRVSGCGTLGAVWRAFKRVVARWERTRRRAKPGVLGLGHAFAALEEAWVIAVLDRRRDLDTWLLERALGARAR
jgi:hypothetical protein